MRRHDEMAESIIKVEGMIFALAVNSKEENAIHEARGYLKAAIVRAIASAADTPAAPTYFCDTCDASCDPMNDPHCLGDISGFNVTLCENCRDAAYDGNQERLMEDGGGPSLIEQQREAYKIKRGLR